MPQMPHTSLKASLVWNTTAQLVSRVVSALTTLVITIVIARQFGANGFGDFVKITTYVAFFYLLADFGFNAMYLQRKSEWEDLLGLRLIVSSALILIASAVILLFPHGTTQGYTQVVRLGILLFVPSILFQALITTGNALFQKHLRYDLSTVAITVGSLVSLLCVFSVSLFSNMFPTVLWATTAVLLGLASSACVSLVLSRKLQKVHHSVISKRAMYTLFLSSVPLGLTLLFNLVYFRVDSIILTLTRSTAEVGVYGLAYKIFEIPLVFPTFFMNALYPVMLQETDGKTQETGKALKNILIRSSVFLVISSIIISAVLWICAPIIALIKPEFISGIPAIRVLSFGLPFFFLSGLTMWILIARKKQNILAVIYGVSMIINIFLNYIFIPIHGFIAAAWITVGSEALVLGLTGYFAIQTFYQKS